MQISEIGKVSAYSQCKYSFVIGVTGECPGSK